MMMKKTTILGTFECTSGRLQVTDPSAQAASICHPAKNGIWEVKTEYTGDGKVFALNAKHCCTTESDIESMESGEFVDSVRVEGGVIGIFDYDPFHLTMIRTEHGLRQELQEKVSSPNLGGTIACGAVVSPGGGNGEYAVSCVVDKEEKLVQPPTD
jgi:hypothetical protein